MMERLTRDQECDRILGVCGPDNHEAAFRAIDVQFKYLQHRAQVVLGIAGVLVSTSVLLMTGKIIIRVALVHEQVMSPLVIAAGGTAILAAAIIVGFVLRVRWMTELPGSNLRAWIMSALRYRDSKTRAYRVSIMVLLVSMACFQAAAIIAWVR